MLSKIEEKVLEAYIKTAEPIGDSDLYDEQPRVLMIGFTLGELRALKRRAAMASK